MCPLISDLMIYRHTYDLNHLHTNTPVLSYYSNSKSIWSIYLLTNSQWVWHAKGSCSQTLPTIAGSPWQVSQGSSSVIAALSFITGIIRCTFNKPWSQIGILSYTPVNNAWIREHCLGLLVKCQIKVLKPSMFCKVKYQHQHISQGQKFIVVRLHAKFITVETTGSRISTDPITISIIGFSFLFWQGLSFSHSCVRSPTDAPSVTNTELLSASRSSPFQANKFIHPVLC